MAIMDVLSKDQYFQRLMALFFERKTGYDGQKVVIAPKDPMLEESSLDDMDETALAELTTTIQEKLGQMASHLE